MSYRFASAEAIEMTQSWCLDVLTRVKEHLKNFFELDIDIRLLGGDLGELVLQDSYDFSSLSYLLIIKEDKNNLIDTPTELAFKVERSFDALLSEQIEYYTPSEDEASVINITVGGGGVNLSLEAGVFVEREDGYLYRLVAGEGAYFKNTWLKVEGSENCFRDYEKIKEMGYLPEFQEKFLKRKNKYASKEDEVKAFFVFLEVLDELRGRI